MNPLRQSSAELLACDELYAAVEIQGQRMPANLASSRGTEVHSVMWEYITHCVQRTIPSDWGALDRFAAKKGAEPRQILRNMRDNYVVDYEGSMGAELTLSLDAQFQPCENRVEKARYQVTIDHLRSTGPKGTIEDFKTHPAPFEPDTIQAHLYPLVAFQTYSFLEEITFALNFARYPKCWRNKVWTREQVPFLMEYVQSLAERQADLHQRFAAKAELEAMPGPHCQYCPKMVGITCPIAKFNEHVTHTPKEWLQYLIWSTEMQKKARSVLKSAVVATEQEIQSVDGHGTPYVFNSWPAATIEYPLVETTDALLQWRQMSGEDLRPFMRVGSTELKNKMKAKKRAALVELIANVADPQPTTRWGVKVAGKEQEEAE